MSAQTVTSPRVPARERSAARPPLRVARSAPSTSSRPLRRRLFFRPVALSVTLIVASLLAVVIGNMLLTSGQLQLEQLQARLAATTAHYAVKLDRFTQLESPTAAVRLQQRDHLVLPAQVFSIPAVPLSRRLAPPTLSSAPCCALTPG
jgi:hypothetical protein